MRNVPVHKLDIPNNLSGIEPLFAAMRWPSDRRSKQAWEQASRFAEYVSVWRTRFPLEPPHIHFCCIVMGEKMEYVQEAIRVMATVPKWTAFEIDSDMASALAMRRYRLAMAGTTTQITRNKPHTLDGLGRMHPFDGPTL